MRNLNNMNQEQAKTNGWTILKPLQCEVVGKAVYENSADSMTIMKSTKRFKVDGGWIYNTSTEINSNGRVSVAEALCFVPDKS